MFASLQNPMAYIIAFQTAVLLVPAFVALGYTLRSAEEGAHIDENLRDHEVGPEAIEPVFQKAA